jgi:hypothetical protein
VPGRLLLSRQDMHKLVFRSVRFFKATLSTSTYSSLPVWRSILRQRIPLPLRWFLLR